MQIRKKFHIRIFFFFFFLLTAWIESAIYEYILQFTLRTTLQLRYIGYNMIIDADFTYIKPAQLVHSFICVAHPSS
jgi:hypothetical protein